MSDRKTTSNAPFNQPGAHRRALFTALQRRDLREAWWTLLDAWETRKTLRRLAFGFTALLIFGSIFWFGFYPRWTQRNAIRMARQWIEAGKPEFAAETVQKALARDPKQPELWSLAAELARLNRQKDLEVEYAHRAAQAAPGDAKFILEWASAALRAEMPEVAEQALSELPPDELARSSFAHRMLGEMRRRTYDLPAAREHFETALKIDGSSPVNEIPLGLCLLADREPASRHRGSELLNRWTADPQWGATASRILLDDTLRSGNREAILRHALALKSHPQCTFGDMPVCLQGLAFADNGEFVAALADLQKKHRASPEAAAQLVGWLNQIGKSAEALAWMQSFPENEQLRPPLSQAKAESLRALGDWPALQSWTATGDWGTELDFIRWSYGLLAARKLGDERRSEELWNTLYGHAFTNSVHAHFAGSLIYSWGLVKESEELWWRAAGQSDGVAYESLGSLARHYQVQRDAEGQYKVFAQLHSLRPQDDDVTNNFVFFAVLTGKREQQAERLARELMQRHPNQPTYTATYAYVLVANGHAAEALRLMEPLSVKYPNSSAVRFAYGLALAGVDQKEKARPILERLPPESLTTREVEMIGSLLSR
jgi:Tfp pilus assembly protein PilF